MTRRTARTVRAPDGRVWAISRTPRPVSARPVNPAEHDVASGGAGAILTACAVFWVVVAYLFVHGHPHVPLYFGIAPALLILVALVWRAHERPWVVRAEALDPPEVWTGVALGRGHARSEMRIVGRTIRYTGTPNRPDGRLERETATP